MTMVVGWNEYVLLMKVDSAKPGTYNKETMENKNSNGLSVPVAIIIAGLLIAGAIIYVVGSGDSVIAPTGNTTPTQTQTKEISAILKIGGRDVVTGDVNAPVTLIEYGDFQCPFCHRYFSQAEPLIRENYIKTGKVKAVYRDLAFLGAESQAAAESAECAKDQSKFWEYHDALYKAETEDGQENNGNLTKDFFLKLAGDLKMDTAAFGSCIDSHKYQSYVKQQSADGETAIGNLTSPVAFINGAMVKGAQPYDTFKVAIDSALAQK